MIPADQAVRFNKVQETFKQDKIPADPIRPNSSTPDGSGSARPDESILDDSEVDVDSNAESLVSSRLDSSTPDGSGGSPGRTSLQILNTDDESRNTAQIDSVNKDDAMHSSTSSGFAWSTTTSEPQSISDNGHLNEPESSQGFTNDQGFGDHLESDSGELLDNEASINVDSFGIASSNDVNESSSIEGYYLDNAENSILYIENPNRVSNASEVPDNIMNSGRGADNIHDLVSDYLELTNQREGDLGEFGEAESLHTLDELVSEYITNNGLSVDEYYSIQKEVMAQIDNSVEQVNLADDNVTAESNTTLDNISSPEVFSINHDDAIDAMQMNTVDEISSDSNDHLDMI